MKTKKENNMFARDSFSFEFVDIVEFNLNKINFVKSIDQLEEPNYIKFYNNIIYVSDFKLNTITLYDSKCNYMHTLPIKSGKMKNNILGPMGFEIHNNLFYVCDNQNKRIQIYDVIKNYAHRGKIGNPGELNSVECIKWYNNKLFISDSKYHCIHVYDIKNNKLLYNIGEFGTSENQLNNPSGFTIKDNTIYICDRGNSRIKLFDINTGEYQKSFNIGYSPRQIKIFNDTIFITHSGNYISMYSLTGELVNVFGLDNNFLNVKGIDIFNGKIIVSDINESNSTVSLFNIAKYTQGV